MTAAELERLARDDEETKRRMAEIIKSIEPMSGVYTRSAT